ncbi:NAD(P)/FAD-dependent oxidoreductase [Candidatus Uhrbacteria bacterium]|jgi:pyruvate/2-oxoglutarate dehydrogenase complex dihydrolipoamide dehydrogenase (E3) component|nr:NAD(P)/FAD-dependent oxidoreductase [Candidatus Uhrbacteria bacterium]
MAKKKTYDVIVLGTGSAGFSAVEGALAAGAKVCVIEKEKLGGECPNYACVPSKAILKAAKVYRMMRHAREFGLNPGKVSFDFASVMKYRGAVVSTITGGGEYGDRYHKILKGLGVDVKIGTGTFVDDHTIEVDGETLVGKAIVIATGTVDFVPSIMGIDTANFWHWKDAIQAKKQPKSLAIIGGGPVGCEIATFFATFGTRVVLLQGASTILNHEDAEIANIAQEEMVKLGVDVRSGVNIKEIINARGGVYGIRVDDGGEVETVAVERLLVATGKRSNVQGINLESTGVKLDDRGVLKINKEQRTNVKHVFGAGDVTGGMQFTHTAHHEGMVAGYNAALVAKKKRTVSRKVDERVVPRVTFVEPEVASVGMTAAQAKEKFKTALVGTYQVGALGRAVTENARVGLVKIVAHPKTRKVLGGHMIGDRAGEVIHEVALAMHLNITVDKLASMIHAFPTYSEGVKAAAANVKIEK